MAGVQSAISVICVQYVQGVFTRDLILIRVFYVIVGSYVESILNEKNTNAIFTTKLSNLC